MANSANPMDYVQTAQASKEVTVNQFMDLVSPAAAYGRRGLTTAGLVWGYQAATLVIGGVPVQIPAGTLTFTDNAVTYVEVEQTDGSVHQNILGWTPGRTPLYIVTTVGGFATVWLDKRPAWFATKNMATLALAGDSAFQVEHGNSDIVVLTGSPAAAFNVTVPTRPWEWTIRNKTGQDATFTTGSGATVTVAAGKNAKIMADGTEVARVSADV